MLCSILAFHHLRNMLLPHLMLYGCCRDAAGQSSPLQLKPLGRLRVHVCADDDPWGGCVCTYVQMTTPGAAVCARVCSASPTLSQSAAS